MDIASFFEKTNQLSIAGEYAELIEHFETGVETLGGYQQDISNDNLIVLAHLPVKWYAMQALQQEEALQQDIGHLIDAYKDSDVLLMNLCQVIIQQDLGQFLPYLKTAFGMPKRLLLNAECILAEQEGDISARLQAISAFNAAEPPSEFEHMILLTVGDIPFDRTHLQSADLQDLPDDNGFFSAEFQNGEHRLSLLMPLPGNKGLCKEGSLSLESADKTRQFNLLNHQVEPLLAASPFGLSVQHENYRVLIPNVLLYKKPQTKLH